MNGQPLLIANSNGNSIIMGMKTSSFGKLWHAEPRLEHQLAWFFDWRFSAAVLRTRVTGIISLIPLLGYFILYGDQFGRMFLEMEALDGVPGLFEPITRAHLVYFGSILVFVGWALCFFCPWQVRQFLDSWDFAERIIAQRHNGQARAANAFISKLKTQTPQAFKQQKVAPYLFGQFGAFDINNATHNFTGEQKSIFWNGRIAPYVIVLFAAFHASLIRKRRPVALTANAFFIFGILLIALPAMETFVRVVISLFSDLAPTMNIPI